MEQEPNRLIGFRKGLSDAALSKTRTWRSEYRWAMDQNDRLAGIGGRPGPAAVAVIVAVSSQPATIAAKRDRDHSDCLLPGPATRLPPGLVRPASNRRAATQPESAP